MKKPAKSGRRTATGTPAARVEDFQNAALGVPLPEGVYLSTAEEKLLWDQYSAARAPQDWPVHDLLQLHRLVKTEIRARRYSEVLDILEGPTAIAANGSTIMNPTAGALDREQRSMLSLLRFLDLKTRVDARQMRSRAKATAEAKATLERGERSPNLHLLAGYRKTPT